MGRVGGVLGSSGAVLGRLGASCIVLGASWRRIGSKNPPNINLTRHGTGSAVFLKSFVWLSVALCGSLWLSVALCGSLFFPVALCGSLWLHEALCVSQQRPKSTPDLFIFFVAVPRMPARSSQRVHTCIFRASLAHSSPVRVKTPHGPFLRCFIFSRQT